MRRPCAYAANNLPQKIFFATALNLLFCFNLYKYLGLSS